MRQRMFLYFFIFALLLEIILFRLGLELLPTIAITFIAIIGGYTVWWSISSKRLNNILDERCDPYQYIEFYEKRKKLSKRINYQNFCNFNIAVGLISLGRDEEALHILTEDIDSSRKNSNLFVTAYYLALFTCYINTNKLEDAKLVYESHIKQLRKIANAPMFVFVIDISFLEYQYKLNKTPETAMYFLQALSHLHDTYNKKLSTRITLEVMYTKANLLSFLGDTEGAAKNYVTVAQKGNNLWVAQMSRKKLG